MSISREHADVWLHQGQVAVRCLETARNSTLINGQSLREALIPCGGSFQIGATAFQIRLCEPVEEAPAPADSNDDAQEVMFEHSYGRGELKKFGFGSAEQQIEIISNLPKFIALAKTDDDLALMIARLLLQGIPQADAVAVVHYDEADIAWDPSSKSEPNQPGLMKVETREGLNVRFRPSRRLLLKSLRQQQSMMHIWGETEGSSTQFTMSEGLGWVYCSPMRGEGCGGWCLYVSGKGTRGGSLMVTEEDLRGDLRFTELLAQFIGSIRHVRHLQDQRTQLSAFFSPKVIENLTAGQSAQSLEPAERDVTVLFCDLRGFSKRSETLQHDLLMLLKSVSEALGVMADGVLGMDGAIADFQGDAVLGFWGWPLPHAEGPLPACRAALRIDSEFRRFNDAGHQLLKGLSCGVGIAHGRALAGKIGTERQSKIGVFGPVVDLGSRLEGWTKLFGVSICVDLATAEYVRKHPAAAELRIRKLARVRTKGGETFDLFTLYPSAEALPAVSTSQIAAGDAAVEAVSSGHWNEAREILNGLPAADGPATFLRAFLEKAGIAPPPDWDGAIPLDVK